MNDPMGQIMKETKGKANPKLVNEIIRKKIGI
jgi:Asp-tRNA(Asn)/Glu-tRNA(Gln) amidotransferase B subunit